jgi:hypothetical protein
MVSLSFFFPVGITRREAPELDKEAMVGVDERLKEATSYPAKVERRRFVLFIFLPLTFVGREASLLFYILI